ncbi:MAG: hypothetical protein AAF481_06805 [Acidobacteriota bacterium]
MNRSILCIALAVLLIVPAAVGAHQIDEGEPISLSFRDADLAMTIAAFAQIAGATVDADGPLEGTVTVELKEVTWRQALATICRLNGLGCTVEDHPTPTIRIVTRTPGGAVSATDCTPSQPPADAAEISISLKGADLFQTLRSFGRLSNLSVVIHPGVRGAVTFDAENQPWTEVAEEICRLVGCRIQWCDTELEVFAQPPASASTEEELRTFDVPRGSLAAKPLAGTPSRWIRAQLTTTAGETAESVLRFTWNQPVYTLTVADGWSVVLSWLPLSQNLHTGVATLVHCVNGVPHSLDTRLVPLPLADDWRWQVAGTTLELVDSPDPQVDAPGSHPAPLCLGPAGGRIDAWLEAAGGGSKLTLNTTPGRYLLITPHSSERPTLGATAFVVIGASAIDGLELLRIDSRDGQVFDRRVLLQAGETQTLEIDPSIAEGSRLELRWTPSALVR